MRLFAISIIILALSWSAEAFAEITATQVKLYWDAPVVGQGQSAPDHFILQRKDAACSSSGNFVDVDKVGAQVFNIVDLNVQQQARYCYRVISANAAGMRSVPSNTAEAEIPLGELAPATNLRLTP